MNKFALVFVLISAVLFGCAKQAAPVADTKPDGKKTAEEKCAGCHSYDKVSGHNADKSGWASIMSQMKSHGMSVTPDEETAILDYLVKSYSK